MNRPKPTDLMSTAVKNVASNGARKQSLNNSISSMFYTPPPLSQSSSYPHTTVHSVNELKPHFTGSTTFMRRRSSGINDRQDMRSQSMNEKLSSHWIESVFQRRECIKFIPEGNSDRCGCGRLSSAHSQPALSRFTTSVTKSCNSTTSQKWMIENHTASSPTDAYGIIEFQGGMHAHKAHYLRLAYDSDPANVMHLMEKIWNLQRPRLVITIHGGMTNFKVADKLGRLFRGGMLKAAETTGAWILTSGIDSGVVRHVAKALDEVVTIGIAPWGLLRRREKLLGRDAHIPYDRHSFLSRSRYAVLNDRHSYFLLVDNGTVGRYGADIIFRKRFEEFLTEKQTLYCGGPHRIPIVCLALEGGLYTLNSIHEYLTRQPAIPVLICEGSGRISDFLAFAERNQNEDGTMEEDVRQKLLETIRLTFPYDNITAESILTKIHICIQQKGLLTVFRLHEDLSSDVDHVILRALLKGQMLSLQDQLSLTLAWDRVDIARSEVLQDSQEWSMHSLHSCMMDALLLNRVEFVKLLLENGVSLRKFLTIGRLEQLYNSDTEHLSTLYDLIGYKTNVDQDGECTPSFTLPEIGVAIEKLMGNAYRCHYTTRSFKSRYDKYHGKYQLKRNVGQLNINSLAGDLSASTPMTAKKRRLRSKKRMRKRGCDESSQSHDYDFRYPFNDLILWAVLTRRHETAKCLWQYGEEALAKALTAIRLYKCMSKEAADDYTEVEVSNQLREYADDFRECSLELLNHCYQQDDMMTMRLLTAELPNWGHHTCLSLAVIANNKRFLAHPCCQILLAELWHGGLRFRSQSNIKVVLAVLFPPTILLLDFKTFAQQKFKSLRTRAGDGSVLVDDADVADFNDMDSLNSNDNERTTENLLPPPTRFSCPPKKKDSLEQTFFKRGNAALTANGDELKTSLSSSHHYQNFGHQHNYRHTTRHSVVAESPFTSTPISPPNFHGSAVGANTGDISFCDDDDEPTTSSLNGGGGAAKRVQIVSSRQISDDDDGGGELHQPFLLTTTATTMTTTTFRRQISMTSSTTSRLHGVRLWKSQLLDCVSKFVLFYRAPITSFWIWSISFCIFMLALIYVLLVEFPKRVSWLEYFLFAYVLALGMEHFRKLLILESSSFMEKVRVFYNRYWNVLTTIAVLTYFIGFAFRFHGPTIHTYSRIILASNSLLWHMKLFDFLSVHPRIGPYITMAGKMILAMSYIIVMLLVTLMAFGVVRQSITFPHEKWSWILVRNIFYKPYFMLYGEVYAGEIDTCGDEGTNCVPGGWIPPMVMVIFLLVANILLINMLIAIFNNIFNVTNAMSQQVWMFQRYEQVLEYKSTPIVPPPLTPLVHLFMLVKHFCSSRNCRRQPDNHSADFAIKVYLGENELKRLHDFEEDCMDDLSRRKTLQEAGLNHHFDAHEYMENLGDITERLKELNLLKTQMSDLIGRIEAKVDSSAVIDRKGSTSARPSSILLPESLTLKPSYQKELRIIPKARVTPMTSFFDVDDGIPPTPSQENSLLQSIYSALPNDSIPPRRSSANYPITEPQHQSSSVNRTNNNQQQYPLNASGQLSTSAPHKYSTSIMNDLDQILQFHHSHLSDARKNSNNEGSKKASGTERKNSTNFELSTLSFGNLGSSSSSSSPNSSSCSLESMNRMTIEVNKRNDDERDKPIP